MRTKRAVTHGTPIHSRIDLLDWLKGCAIIAVVLDHLKIVPEPYVVWSVNLFVLVTAFIYSQPGYNFSFKKLALKISQLFYSAAFAILLIYGLNTLFNIPAPQPLLSVFLNPYAFLIYNKYLGNIWYIALHLQFLVLFYLFLKTRAATKPSFVIGVAAAINLLSVLVTHFVFGRFHTLPASSWLIFLSVGFYGMRPFLKIIENFPPKRLLWATSALGFIFFLYGLYPLFPWLFTNSHRALFITLPFYFALIFFLTESFYILKGFKAGELVTSIIRLLGRHSLAIYLTHAPLKYLWATVFSSWLLVAALCILSGVAFGTLADRLFLKLGKWGARIGRMGYRHAIVRGRSGPPEKFRARRARQGPFVSMPSPDNSRYTPRQSS